MDGTLVDTERYWMAAEEELVEAFGGTWTHDEALALVGSGLWESARVFQAKGVVADGDGEDFHAPVHPRSHHATARVALGRDLREFLLEFFHFLADLRQLLDQARKLA